MVAIKISRIMKKEIIIILICLLSCSFCKHEQKTSIYKVREETPVVIPGIGVQGYEIEKNYFLGYSIDEIDLRTGEWYKKLMFYHKENAWDKQQIAKVDLSDGHYSDTLLFFETENSLRQVIIWKKEGEYWSYIDIFLFTGETIELLTDIALGVVCSSCETFNFPEDDIRIVESRGKLEILFNGDVHYHGSESHKLPYHSVNVKTQDLRVIQDEDSVRIIY